MARKEGSRRHSAPHDGAHGGGHHGGAWKVAYADFTTAMMAFFLLMWILAASTPQQKKAIANYFRSQGPLIEGGSVMTGQFEGGDGFMQLPPQNGVMEQTRALEKLGEDLGKTLDESEIKGMRDQVAISLGDEGLVIDITDDPQDELFAIGSAAMNPDFAHALDAVAASLTEMPNNRVRIEGYTDARQYAANASYTNWELSVDRANAARRRLETRGLDRSRFESVVGYGDGRLSVPDDPMAPGNRRITITVLKTPAPPAPAPGDGASAQAEGPEAIVPIGKPIAVDLGRERLGETSGQGSGQRSGAASSQAPRPAPGQAPARLLGH
jgi:chemotaxis protein MotB